MARQCQLSGKKPMVGNNVSHSNAKTKRRFNINLVKKISPAMRTKMEMPDHRLGSTLARAHAGQTELPPSMCCLADWDDYGMILV